MKKWTMGAIALGLIGGLILTAVMLQTVGLKETFTTFVNAKPGNIIGFLAVSVSLALLLTVKWQYILMLEHIHLPFGNLIQYRMIGYAISYLTPTAKVGGEPVRAYLVSRHKVPFTRALSSVIVDKSIELVIHGTVFAVGALLIVNLLKLELRAKVIIAGLSLLSVVLLLFFGAVLVSERHKIFLRLFRILGLHRFPKLKPVEEKLVETEVIVERFYHERRRAFYWLIVLNISTWILMYFEYLFALRILGHDGTVLQIFLLLTAVGVAYLIPVPMAVGVLELTQVGATGALGIPAALGVALGMLIRARDLLWTGVGGIFLVSNQLSARKLYANANEAATSEKDNIPD